jgi:hypothetical protein
MAASLIVEKDSGELLSAGEAELLVDVLEPAFDGADREAQLVGDLFVGVPGGGEEGRVAFGRGEAGTGLDGLEGRRDGAFRSFSKGGCAMRGRAGSAGVSCSLPGAGAVGGGFGREQVGAEGLEGGRGVVEADRIAVGEGLCVSEFGRGEVALPRGNRRRS